MTLQKESGNYDDYDEADEDTILVLNEVRCTEVQGNYVRPAK